MGSFAVFGHLTLVHTGERQFSFGVGEERGKRDGILAIGSPSTPTSTFLNITGLLVGVDNNIDSDGSGAIRGSR